ncbi:Anhydro-N-acetylmuramic acid kinase [Aquitalea magnusonii]|uniref:Anhydro-N-acetylmuramic acid kinase n=1 Tax=Aquitalea magnusonii TaxID=332411 RepID=A0A3G9GDH5_9NEIS|nr:anhydro-N-acetylmuramic acid kinase [Aquitalea magnusonii]BBF85414.1 Anhydro-N-acetylmuramic acid kinase [Aquitalea magnusonii]
MTERYIGLMSGTSLDGVDAVLLCMDEHGRPHVEADSFLPFPDSIKQQVLALQAVGNNELDRAAQLGNALARLYAEVVARLLAACALPAAAIRAIGCHGQTIRHAPHEGYTLQIGNAALLAELSGIDVIADFRSRDVAAGGHGAPLVPAFHQDIFASDAENRVILNIGGISNLTRLAKNLPTCGFDCGPGNMLLDAWCQLHTGAAYDADGNWAASGQLHPALLQQMLADAYFRQQPPKSTGRDLFSLEWLQQQLATQPPIAPQDVQHSLLQLTAISIAHDIHRYCPDTASIYVCGGGALNRALMQALQQQLPAIAIHSTAEIGLPANQVEAAAFAWLAWRFCHRLPANLPEVTGAAGLRVLGALYPA